MALGLTTTIAQDIRDSEELALNHPAVRAVIAVQERVTPGLMNLPGVLGTAVGADQNGLPALVLYVDQDSPSRADLVRSLPPQLRGIGVKVELTEKFQAYANTARQTPPIQLGTSGGWTFDFANGYCCGGTLGALIRVNGIIYILSNYHVFEADTLSGGNGIIANTGDPVIQPGLQDSGCTSGNAQVVGNLVRLGSLPASNVDVSIAAVQAGMVATNGSILGIGTVSRNTLAAKLKQGVKKSGRTTGLTRSSVTGLNATVSVAYASECAGGVAFTKTFTGQIVVSNGNNAFLAQGDSGSLLVENVSVNPRAIGLLFAGSTTGAIANPIGQVLTFVGGKLGGTATMVGN